MKHFHQLTMSNVMVEERVQVRMRSTAYASAKVGIN